MTHEKRRYSAEELMEMAESSQIKSLRAYHMLRQAASTEAKRMGLVEMLEAIVDSWKATANSKCDDDYTFGRRQVAITMTDEIREALSKFRGGENEAV